MVLAARPPTYARAQRSARRQRSYCELTSDEDLSDISPVQSQTRAVRSSKRVRRRNYKEEEDSCDAAQSTSDADSEVLSHSNGQQAHQTIPSRRSHKTASSVQRKRTAPVDSTKSKAGLVSQRRGKLSDTTNPICKSAKPAQHEQLRSSGAVPRWQELEYQILLQIFKYAAYPLYVGASHARPTIQWLLDVSLLSKSFRAAALAALLYSPPIYPAQRAHDLLHLLRHNQDNLSTNYRSKIRVLNVEARNLLMKKNGVLVQDLVGQLTPLVSVLNIYHSFDLTRPTTCSKPETPKKNWTYPLDLFNALDEAGIHLKGFSWNGRFPETKQVLEMMPSLHQRPCLHGLQSLSLLNMSYLEKSSKEENESLLTSALSNLPEVAELAFENCAILTETLLARLPIALRRLNITTCANATSHGLGVYLQQHGYELRGLQLMGNQAMDLGYLPALASNCPKLQTVEVNLTYSDPLYYDIDPHYDELLPHGQPTWPAALRVVEFENLRNLDAAEADGFFQSLVDSAHKLKDLRRLSLKAILKIGWRDRAQLREKWKAKLENIFLRKSPPPHTFELKPSKPSPIISSLETAADTLMDSGAEDNLPASPHDDSDSAGNLSRKSFTKRKSSRIAQKELESLKAPVVGGDVRILAHRPRNLVDGLADRDQGDNEFIHGMVDEVFLRLDDQRPAEAQFNEGDFLDSEQSDEDWDGT